MIRKKIRPVHYGMLLCLMLLSCSTVNTQSKTIQKPHFLDLSEVNPPTSPRTDSEIILCGSSADTGMCESDPNYLFIGLLSHTGEQASNRFVFDFRTDDEADDLEEAQDYEEAGDYDTFEAGREDEVFSQRLGIGGVNTADLSDIRLISHIQEWLQTPYQMGGCSKNGIDCSCFVKTIYKEVYGIDLTRTSRDIFQEMTPINKSELSEGDTLFFKIGRRGGISHVGIYLKDGKFVHASRKYGVVIDDLDHEYYRKRFIAAGRINRFPTGTLSEPDRSDVR